MHVKTCACGTSMQVPSPAMCQLQAGGLTTHSENCHACGRQHESAWQSEVDRMLSLLVTRVAGVEETMDNVVGGISNIMWELDVISRYVRKNAAVYTSTNIVHVQATHVDVATSTPFEWQQCNNQSNVGNVVVDVATPLCPQKQSVLHPDEPLHGTAARPIPVDLENMSSRSRDNPTTRNGRKCIADSPATRVHSQPRLRVVLCSITLIAVPAPTGDTPNLVPYAPKYKDPPDYDNAANFG